jgi:hypothetical protein
MFNFHIFYLHDFFIFTIFAVNNNISITVVPISRLLSVDSSPSCIRRDEFLMENDEDSPQGKMYKRETWSKGVEFLFSCIAMSVGLGNLWRFPFVGKLN